MTLLRAYLQFFNTPGAWTVYAARNQNLSVPSDTVETHNTIRCGEEEAQPPRHGHSDSLRGFWNWVDRTQ